MTKTITYDKQKSQNVKNLDQPSLLLDLAIFPAAIGQSQQKARSYT
jgi:D-serine deaminase-like pyridoxal phosphate-dependent protein